MAADPADFHRVRRSALDCSPRPGDGYCDLGSFLDAASDLKGKGSSKARLARRSLKQAVIASCGRASGLTIYAPGNFRPKQAGSTDALYMGLNFVRETEWGTFLGEVYPPLEKAAPGVETLPIPTPSSGLDRYNARRILAAVRSGAKEGWIDRLRGEVLGPCRDVVSSLAEQIDRFDPRGMRSSLAPPGKSGKRPGGKPPHPDSARHHGVPSPRPVGKTGGRLDRSLEPGLRRRFRWVEAQVGDRWGSRREIENARRTAPPSGAHTRCRRRGPDRGLRCNPPHL